MPQQWFDPSSKWMLEEHGASILYLAGARNVLSCRARKAEVVQPRKLPDGLLEARFADAAETRLILVEVATYPEKRVVQQVCDDLRLVRQTHGALIDAIVVCLCPKGTYRVPDNSEESSPLGWSNERLRWKVVELWTLSAEELLAAPNIGVVPLATLARYDGPPEVLLQLCRDRIDREGGDQHENLLAVTQIFARLHFDKPEWLNILGGSKMIIETPFIQGLMQESMRTGRIQATIDVLEGRFGSVTPTITAGLEMLKEMERLKRLTQQAVTCSSLQEFEAAVHQELPQPAPRSTRGKKRKKGE